MSSKKFMKIKNNFPKKPCLTLKSSQQAETKLVNRPAWLSVPLVWIFLPHPYGLWKGYFGVCSHNLRVGEFCALHNTPVLQTRLSQRGFDIFWKVKGVLVCSIPICERRPQILRGYFVSLLWNSNSYHLGGVIHRSVAYLLLRSGSCSGKGACSLAGERPA